MHTVAFQYVTNISEALFYCRYFCARLWLAIYYALGPRLWLGKRSRFLQQVPLTWHCYR